MSIEFDAATQSALNQLLHTAFPSADIHDYDLDAVAVGLYALQLVPNSLPPAAAAKVQSLGLQRWATQLESYARSLDLGLAGASQLPYLMLRNFDPGATRYYWAQATHARQRPNGYEPFVGELAMARVRLPQTDPTTFGTEIGTIESSDHLIASVDEANRKYASDLGYALTRVDLVTPPRLGVRFGAVSVLLGYQDPRAQPSCFMLEAGTALGQAKVTFLGKTISTQINEYTGYQPTPFSCSDNAYTGTLTLNGDSPLALDVTSRQIIGGASQAPYIGISVQFTEEHNKIRYIWPGLLIARAALIVELRKALPLGCDKTGLPT
jgi:hypothetical protein